MAKRRASRSSSVVRMAPEAAATGWRPDQAAPVEPTGSVGEKVKIISWGGNNLLPQDVLRIVYDSGTAESCITRRAQFIGGKGFASKTTATTKANERQTLNQLLAEAKWDAAFEFGLAIVVRYTFGGEVGEVFFESADCTRVEKDGAGRLVVNYGLAEGNLNTKDNRVYLPYDAHASQEDISAQVIVAFNSEAGYWGHLWYVFEAKPGRTNYPVPSYYSGKEDIENDAATSKYDLKQSRNGFMPDAWVTLIGAKFDDIADPDFQPGEGESYDNAPSLESPDLADFKKTIKGLKGTETDSSVGISVVENQDQVPQWEFFDKGPNSKNLTDMVNRLVGKVCRHMGVPPVLIGVQEAGMLGSNQQIVNSIQLFGLVVNPARQLITEALGQLFPGLDMTVTPLDPVDYIDPGVLAKMSDSEIRALRGLPPLDTHLTQEQKDTVTALQSLPTELRSSVLGTLTTEELRAFLPALPGGIIPTPTPATT